MSTKKKTSAKKSSAKKSSEAEGTATAELTEAEILEMQDSMSSEWGEGAPRKAKAFWQIGRAHV